MRIVLILALSFLASFGYAQSSSNHYKSVVRGSMTSGAIQSSSHASAAVVNIWTEAHRQSSNLHVNRARGSSHNPDSTLSISNMNFIITGLTIYPNPARNFISIQSTEVINTVEVFDAMGKLVYHKAASEDIDVSDWQKGLYLIIVTSGNKMGGAKMIKL